MKRSILTLLVGSFMVFAGSCGSSGGDSCGNAEPCGGDIVGDWTITSSCLSFTGASPLGDSCPDATIDAGGIKLRGTMSFKADMTYTEMLTISGSMTLTFPPSCLTYNGITLTCAQLDQAVKQAQAQDPDPSIQSISCSGSGSCRCTAVMAPDTNTTPGTYTTSGSTLVQDGTDSSGYCVQGSQLHLSAMDMGQGVAGSLVLKK
jgi:hypothetical protein